MIRRDQLMISSQLMAQLRCHAELHSTGGPEGSAELLLAEALAREPAIADLAEMQAKARREARKAWAAKWKIEEDLLP